MTTFEFLSINPFVSTNLRCPSAGHLQATQLRRKDGGGRTLTLQADAFAGFEALYATGAILEAACWAHARRKFFEIHQPQGSPIAADALKRIAA